MLSHLTEDERNVRGYDGIFTMSSVFSVQRLDFIDYGGNVSLAQSVRHPC